MTTITNSTDLTKVSDAPVYAYNSLPGLPQDLINHILLCLDVKNTHACSLVNIGLYQMTCDKDLWRMLFQRDFNLPVCNQRFCEAYQIQSNILNGVYASYPLQRYLQGATALIAADGKVFVGCNDNTIKVWDTETGKCLHILRGHKLKINALAVCKEELFSGSDDCTIKRWDLKTGKCSTLKIGAKVTHLVVDDERLFYGFTIVGVTGGDGITTCSRTYGFDLKTGAGISGTMVKGSIQNLAVKGDSLFITSNDSPKEIILWDLKNARQVKKLKGSYNIDAFAVTEETLFLAVTNYLHSWDLKTEYVETYFHDGYPSSNLLADNDMLFLGFTTGPIWLRNQNTKLLLINKNMTGVKINALSFADGKLFAASLNQGCAVYNFRPKHREVLAEIIDLFKSDDYSNYIKGCERFKSLPKRQKDGVYGQLYLIMKPFANDYWGCAEDAFFCRNEESTSEQRVHAIENYLKLEYPNESYSEHGSCFEEVDDDRVHYPPLMLGGIAATRGVYELFASRSPQLLFNAVPGLPDQLAAASAGLHNLAQAPSRVRQTLDREAVRMWQTLDSDRVRETLIAVVIGFVFGFIITQPANRTPGPQ